MTKAFDAVLIGSAIQKKVNSRRRLVDSYSHWTGNDFCSVSTYGIRRLSSSAHVTIGCVAHSSYRYALKQCLYQNELAIKQTLLTSQDAMNTTATIPINSLIMIVECASLCALSNSLTWKWGTGTEAYRIYRSDTHQNNAVHTIIRKGSGNVSIEISGESTVSGEFVCWLQIMGDNNRTICFTFPLFVCVHVQCTLRSHVTQSCTSWVKCYTRKTKA